ncbi:MAG: HAD family hydrolase [Clostridia bacterium]|nr:HAD family hydrolase [Clostridia bacterium]MDR3643866.1 HAD family hydrolase [Clostridia bacterium]
MIKACIFDLDGTLINSLEDLADSVNYALRLQGYPEHETAEFRYFVGHGAVRLIESSLPQNMRTQDNINVTYSIYRRRYTEHSLDKTRPYDGILEMLEKLREANIRLAVLSNKPDSDTRSMIEALFPHGIFDAVAGHREGLPHKPDPQGAFDVCGAAGIETSACAMLGDSEVDVMTALAAGMLPVGALWGFRDRAELEGAGARFVIESPLELPGLLSRL